MYFKKLTRSQCVHSLVYLSFADLSIYLSVYASELMTLTCEKKRSTLIFAERKHSCRRNSLNFCQRQVANRRALDFRFFRARARTHTPNAHSCSSTCFCGKCYHRQTISCIKHNNGNILSCSETLSISCISTLALFM